MQLYSGSTREFLEDVESESLAAKLEERFVEEYHFAPAESEVRSWRSSLGAMATVVGLAGLDDHGVIVEYQLPLTSRRLDCLFTGHSLRGPATVVVELKQWDYVKPSWVDECVTTTVGMRERDVLHPSAQVGGYARYLVDTNTAFAEGAIALDACAYLHNLDAGQAVPLFAPAHEDLLSSAPVFVRGDDERVGTYLAERLSEGDGMEVLECVAAGRFRPHKTLLEHTAKAIGNEPAWELLDEQRIAFNAVLTKVRERQAGGDQSVFLIRGGPGTGKSVIAIQLVGALSGLGIGALHATGSRAFTQNLRRVVGRRAEAQFSTSTASSRPASRSSTSSSRTKLIGSVSSAGTGALPSGCAGILRRSKS